MYSYTETGAATHSDFSLPGRVFALSDAHMRLCNEKSECPGDGLVPSGNKPEAMFTQFYVVIWYHNDLILFIDICQLQ